MLCPRIDCGVVPLQLRHKVGCRVSSSFNEHCDPTSISKLASLPGGEVLPLAATIVQAFAPVPCPRHGDRGRLPEKDRA